MTVHAPAHQLLAARTDDGGSMPGRLRVLIVGLNYAPEPVGIGPYTAGLAESLAARGHRVEAVVGEPYYPRWQRFTDAPPRARRLERGVAVTRVRHFIPAEPTGARRIVHLASFAVSALWPSLRAAWRLRPDVVFTVAPSLLSIPTAWLAARASGAMLWTHVQDFEVEAAFATGLMRGRGLRARAARWLENRLLTLSDQVSTISPQMLCRLVDKGVPGPRTSELRNWANLDFAPDLTQAERIRAEWGIGSRKVALYSGNIANKQGVEIIVEAARRLAHRDDIVFVICGQGPNRRHLQAMAQGLANVRLYDLQPAERMGGLLALAAVHLLPQIAGAADLVLPSKLTNMLISGRPVIATARHGTGLASEVEGCGMVTEPGDAGSLADAIAALVDDPARAGQLGAAGAARACERWSQVSVIDGFEARALSLTRRRAAAAGMLPQR